jgi:hypothetical protein
MGYMTHNMEIIGFVPPILGEYKWVSCLDMLFIQPYFIIKENYIYSWLLLHRYRDALVYSWPQSCFRLG